MKNLLILVFSVLATSAFARPICIPVEDNCQTIDTLGCEGGFRGYISTAIQSFPLDEIGYTSCNEASLKFGNNTICQESTVSYVLLKIESPKYYPYATYTNPLKTCLNDIRVSVSNENSVLKSSKKLNTLIPAIQKASQDEECEIPETCRDQLKPKPKPAPKQ